MEEVPFKEFFERFFDEGMKRRFKYDPRGDGERHSPMPNYTRAAGSGIIVDAAGHIVTNNHVVEDASEILVTLDGGVRWSHFVGQLGSEVKVYSVV